MPLTAFQREIFRHIAANRSPDSYVAGATVLHRAADSPRFSQDADIFHDAGERVALAAETDIKTLLDRGFAVERTLLTPAFQRATVTRGGEALQLEWALDSAFRFFPVQTDEELGYTLHLGDLATNKILALAGRWEARDFVDALYLHERYASFGLLAWAAAGKDPGLTPPFILEQAARFNRLNPHELAAVIGPAELDLPKMKQDWLSILSEARETIGRLPPHEMGCLYLDAAGSIVDPLVQPDARPHFASLGGATPRLAGYATSMPPTQAGEASRAARAKYRR